MWSRYSNRTYTVRVKNVQKNAGKKTNQGLNHRPAGLTPYALTTQLLPPLLLIELYFCSINGFLVDQ